MVILWHNNLPLYGFSLINRIFSINRQLIHHPFQSPFGNSASKIHRRQYTINRSIILWLRQRRFLVRFSINWINYIVIYSRNFHQVTWMTLCLKNSQNSNVSNEKPKQSKKTRETAMVFWHLSFHEFFG